MNLNMNLNILNKISINQQPNLPNNLNISNILKNSIPSNNLKEIIKKDDINDRSENLLKKDEKTKIPKISQVRIKTDQ